MKHILLTLVFVITSTHCLLGQTKSEHFVYKKTTDVTFIEPKNQVNTLLSKGWGRLEIKRKVNWDIDVKVKHFQELIDQGVFSKERMKELEENEGIMIRLAFDETGIVSYVSFFLFKENKSILTDKELYCIAQKYTGVLFDLVGIRAFDEIGTPKLFFYTEYSFRIPFKDLKY